MVILEVLSCLMSAVVVWLLLHLHSELLILWRKVMEDIAGLTQVTTDTLGAEQSAIVLINGLGVALADAIAKQPVDNGAALAALQTSLAGGAAGLAAAVAANPLPTQTSLAAGSPGQTPAPAPVSAPAPAPAPGDGSTDSL